MRIGLNPVLRLNLMSSSLTISLISTISSARAICKRTEAVYRLGCASIDPTNAQIVGFFVQSDDCGWLTSAAMKMTGSVKIWGRTDWSRMLLTPPILTFILRQRLERVWTLAFMRFLAAMHWVGMPRRVSPTFLTSAANFFFFSCRIGRNFRKLDENQSGSLTHHKW